MRKNIYLTEDDLKVLAFLKQTHGENESHIYRLGLHALSGDKVVIHTPIHTQVERRAFPKEVDRLREAKRNDR